MQLWVIEGAPPPQLSEQGVIRTTLRPDDHVIITVQPGRVVENHRILLESAMRAVGRLEVGRKLGALTVFVG